MEKRTGITDPASQSELRRDFEKARPRSGELLWDELSIADLRGIVELRSDSAFIWLHHLPTGIYGEVIMSMPGGPKRGIRACIEQIDALPPIQKLEFVNSFEKISGIFNQQQIGNISPNTATAITLLLSQIANLDNLTMNRHMIPGARKLDPQITEQAILDFALRSGLVTQDVQDQTKYLVHPDLQKQCLRIAKQSKTNSK